MKKVLVVDDIRVMKFPAVYARHINNAKELLLSEKWDEVWLDHDMGGDGPDLHELVEWIEARAFHDDLFDVNLFVLHSANPIAKVWMHNGLRRFYNTRIVNALDYVKK